MKIVLDTNVLVVGLLSLHGLPASILRLLTSDRAIACFDARILDEYRAVLRRAKFGFDTELVEDVVDYLEATGELIAAAPLDLSLPDVTDAMFIEVAVAASADHLVTGNLKHFPFRERRGVSVVSPRSFVELVQG